MARFCKNLIGFSLALTGHQASQTLWFTLLSQNTSDHIPYVVQFDSSIPRAQIFRFENFWVGHLEFLGKVEYLWNLPSFREIVACLITAKFKTLRSGLKAWSKTHSKLNQMINNCYFTIAVLVGLEEAETSISY